MGQCSSLPSSEEPLPPTPPSSRALQRKKSIPKSLKKLVWDTWVGETVGVTKCLCCGHQDIRQIEFHCGHVVAESKGGPTTVQNLRPICAQCNLSMGSMNMKEFQYFFRH
jgi:5-methylcytosine-specific restriction endonuclease McrA